MIVTRSLSILALCGLAGAVYGMDRAREEMRADEAAAKFKATGEGVLVAIMDRGIDWLNDDFRNEDGSTRIKYIFDLTDDRGAKNPKNPYGIGTIYSELDINRALQGGPQLPTRDAVGHGTTTTAIACGSGRNSPNRKYRGIAPKASIICVKITGGTSAHTDQPEEPAFYDGSRIPIAIDFIRDKARELRMPCVMVLNIGTQGGPTDGTSDMCRKIDQTVGPDKPGLIFVTGPGDDGGKPTRAHGVVKTGEKLELNIKKESPQSNSVRIDLWYAGTDVVHVSIHTPSARYGPYPAPGRDNRITRETKEFALYHNAGRARFTGTTNGKRQIYVDLKGDPGEYKLVLHGHDIQDGRFDATLNDYAHGAKEAPNRFLSHVAPGSIWDGATARNNICPGDYVIRNLTIDIDGNRHMRRGQGLVGELWKGCSVGPTFDGRLGTDFCVPADSVFTTYNPKSGWAQARWNLAYDGNGLYGGASAVSAANPMAAGVIALMLQLKPSLDALSAKKILQQASRPDRFTGKTPNASWGHGKLDVYAALELTTGGTMSPSEERPVIDDLKKLAGKWYAVTEETRGRMASRNEVVAMKKELTVTGDRFVIQRVDQNGRTRAWTGTIKLDETTSPKRFDWSGAGPQGRPQVMMGLYELDGGALQIAYTIFPKRQSGSRPTEFKSRGEGPGTFVITFERKPLETSD